MVNHPDLLWIVKPVASAQGKGIFLTREEAKIPKKSAHVVSQYISNPLLIEKFKFDLRIYVAITSFNPLRVYLFDEGIVRFASCEFSLENIESRFAHLTNYSINKQNDEKEIAAIKWSLQQLKDHFMTNELDWETFWCKVKDLIIKTVLSVETIVNNGMDMYVPHRSNCFDLLGFDVMVDTDLQPWLVEVNLSPSMGCDGEIDRQIKPRLVADLLTLIGVMSKEVRKKDVPRKRHEVSLGRQGPP